MFKFDFGNQKNSQVSFTRDILGYCI